MSLPKAPTQDEKLSFLKTNKSFLYLYSLISVIVTTVGSLVFATSHAPLLIFLPVILLTTSYLALGYYIGLRSYDFDEFTHLEVLGVHAENAVTKSVDIFLPSAGEPLEMLENTYRHVRDISWPNLKVYVLDDSHRDEVKALARKYKFKYIARADSPKDRKAGNLRHAFSVTQSEFILILDADFCPRPDMIQEMLPWMIQDETIGIVQSPQYFSLVDENPISKAASFIQVLFYKLIQVNRDHFSAAICVGSCGLYRRKALEPLGGTYLINYSEDVHTGVSLYPRYKVKYLPINLAMGLSPDTITAFFSQQQRWAAGSLALCTNKMFWDGRFNLNQILCYMTGFLYYITTGISVLLTGVPSLIMLIFYPDFIVWYAVLFLLPSYITTMYVWPKWTGAKFSWWIIRMRLVSYVAHLFALRDKLKGQITPWVVTNNTTGHDRNNKRLRYAYLYLIAVNVVVFVLAIRFMLDSGRVGTAITVILSNLLVFISTVPTYLKLLPPSVSVTQGTPGTGSN